MFMSNLQKRLAVARREDGFTLIELLVVLIIIGVLLAIAVPSYLGFKDRAEMRASGSNVRAAIPAVEAYYADNNTYTGMSLVTLQAIDAGVKLSEVSQQTDTTYCVASTVGAFSAWKINPAGDIVVGTKNQNHPC
jgi:prepilin-type N-terminal cleavage/methylation domain-containing protein